MTDTPEPCSPDLDAIRRLPFVADRKKVHFLRARSFWDVRWAIARQGTADEDYAVGEELALHALAFMAGEPRLASNLLKMVSEDMSLTEEGGLIKAGFWATIALYAQAGYRALGEAPLCRKREDSALFIAGYKAKAAREAIGEKRKRPGRKIPLPSKDTAGERVLSDTAAELISLYLAMSRPDQERLEAILALQIATDTLGQAEDTLSCTRINLSDPQTLHALATFHDLSDALRGAVLTLSQTLETDR